MRNLHRLSRLSLCLIMILGVLLLGGMSSAVAAGAKRGSTLKFVPHADLKVLDPIWTTAYISRNHGYMVYDVLFSLDEQLNIQPQMVESWQKSQDDR